MIDEGVVGVIIWTDDLERLTAFYRDALELPVHSVRPHFVAFEWGRMRFSIGAHAEVKGRTREPRRMMINFGVSDIHKAYETLKSRGVSFIRPPEQEHWGGWVATFTDPDGNTLQLLQQPRGEA
ncbi:MAG: VOC family protein [Chloroflexi bacterium]|nr:VOC family protein [Chloroflexota bacterium]